MKSTNVSSIYRRLCNGLHFIYYRMLGQNHRMDTKFSLLLYLNLVRYLTLRCLWLFFSKQSKLFLLPICNWRLLYALYIVIDFYALQGFFDVKLLFQGTCGFSRELWPRIPHHYDFCISKNGVTLIGHVYATAYIF